MSHDEALYQIESGLIALHKTFFQHKGWEELRKESGVSLDRPEAALLKVLAMSEHGTCRMQQVATYLGIEAPSVTRTAQQLEQDGMVIKRPDSHDRRVGNLHLTAKGRRELEKLLRVRHAHLANLVADWSLEDKVRLGQLLTKLSA
jgi:DNA-binding MarR family transcriptional regulator